jgi:hypothetical protein
LVLERLVHTRLGDLAHERAHAGADGHPQDRDEEQHAEQQAPEHAPGGPAADHVVAGVRVELALLVAHDHRDRVGLDDQVLGQPPGFVGGGVRRGLVGVTDRDQVSHSCISPLSLGHQQSIKARPAAAHPRRVKKSGSARRNSPAMNGAHPGRRRDRRSNLAM